MRNGTIQVFKTPLFILDRNILCSDLKGERRSMDNGNILIKTTEVINLIIQKPGKYYLTYGFKDLANIRTDCPLLLF